MRLVGNSHRGKACATRWENWRPLRLNAPSKKKFRRCAANAALAWSHSAASMKLRGFPGVVFAHNRHRHIFTAAQQGLILRYARQFWAQLKRSLHSVGKLSITLPSGEQSRGRFRRASSCMPCDLAFQDGELHAANASWLTSAKNSRLRSLLTLIDLHE